MCARNIPLSNLAVKRILDDEDVDTKRSKNVPPEFPPSDDPFTLQEELVSNYSLDESAVSDSEEITVPDLPPISPEKLICGHNPSIISPLLEKHWIERDGDHFFTTSLFPGKVSEHSLLVPSSESLLILKDIHFNHGHPTVTGMRKILSLWNLWVFNFKTLAKFVCSQCPSCLICRETYHPQRSVIPMIKHPMSLLMADFLQPEKSLPGFIIIRDRYSGYTEGRAIDKLDSYEVKQLLTEWISRFGVHSIFMTDNAEAFSAENLRNFYSKYHIFHRLSPIYDPRANGSVERAIKSIEEGLRIELLNGIPVQEAVHIVCGRLNRTVNVPGDSSFSSPRNVIFGYDEPRPFYNQHLTKTDFKHDLSVGQPVLVKIPNAPKLGPQYENRNYTIHKVVGNHIYQVSDIDGNVLRFLYRRDRLKPAASTDTVTQPDKARALS